MIDREAWILLRDALRFASERHNSQLRKDGRTPYLDHVIRVLCLILPAKPPAEIMCAALLHDTIEDTATSYDDLRSRFGEAIADVVAELSEDKRLPREVRKQTALEGISRLSEWAKVISLADSLDNLYDLEEAAVPLAKRRKQLERTAMRVQAMGETMPELKQALLMQIDRLAGLLPPIEDPDS